MVLSKEIDVLTENKPLLIYDEDGREGETDIIIPANNICAKNICMLRSQAGGLVCVAIQPLIARTLDLPFMTEVLEVASKKYPTLSEVVEHESPYGDPPAFSLTINHRNTYTGITDNDRALTISELAKLSQEILKFDTPEQIIQKKFKENFKSPGHVHLLIGRNNLLKSRKGHTELSLALAEMVNILPVMVICEMLDGKTGKALSKSEASEYAKRNNISFIEGKDIIKVYTQYKISLVKGIHG